MLINLSGQKGGQHDGCPTAPQIVNLPKIADPRGNLSVIEQVKQIPFEIKRVHWIYDGNRPFLRKVA